MFEIGIDISFVICVHCNRVTYRLLLIIYTTQFSMISVTVTLVLRITLIILMIDIAHTTNGTIHSEDIGLRFYTEPRV